MSLRERFAQDLKIAIKAKESVQVSTLRLILAVLKDRDIAARESGNYAGIAEPDILRMLESMVKQRRESMAMYEQAGRPDAADLEAQEIRVIQSYLPRALTEEERLAAIDTAIQELGAEGLRDMGRVMTHLREAFSGQMDFSAASAEIRARLLAGQR
jgi:uncharacterized protein YqeY